MGKGVVLCYAVLFGGQGEGWGIGMGVGTGLWTRDREAGASGKGEGEGRDTCARVFACVRELDVKQGVFEDMASMKSSIHLSIYLWRLGWPGLLPQTAARSLPSAVVYKRGAAVRDIQNTQARHRQLPLRRRAPRPPPRRGSFARSTAWPSPPPGSAASGRGDRPRPR